MKIADNKNKTIRIVLLGERGVGKTSILNMFLKNEFSEDYNMTNEKNIIEKTFTIKGTNKTYKFEFYDFPGELANKKLLTKDLLFADAIIIVFDINNVDTINKIETIWLNEVKIANRNDHYEKSIYEKSI